MRLSEGNNLWKRGRVEEERQDKFVKWQKEPEREILKAFLDQKSNLINVRWAAVRIKGRKLKSWQKEAAGLWKTFGIIRRCRGQTWKTSQRSTTLECIFTQMYSCCFLPRSKKRWEFWWRGLLEWESWLGKIASFGKNSFNWSTMTFLQTSL